MKSIFSAILFLLVCGSAFAQSPEVNISCSLLEKTKSSTTKRSVLELTTLSDMNGQSVAITPSMASDSEALYILSLSSGEEYKDATDEIIGADYFLSLARLKLPGISNTNKKIVGKTQSIIKIEQRDQMPLEISFTNKKGRRVYKKPKRINLVYKINKTKLIKLSCDIISIK